MENNLSLSVRMLCRKQGITMRQLAEKMQIAPESLSRAINGNPQLSTIQSIASNLNVGVADLFNTSLAQSGLTAIVVFRGKTLVTNNVDSLLDFATEIKDSLQSERITEYDINGKYHAKKKRPTISNRSFRCAFCYHWLMILPIIRNTMNIAIIIPTILTHFCLIIEFRLSFTFS